MNRKVSAALLRLGVVLLACHALRVAEAKTIYVAPDGVDSRTGLTDWTNAVLTISNAVAKANVANDLVLVSNSTYLLTAQITVSSQITVRSWNNGAVDPTNTIVNGNAAVRCFNISQTGAVVEGFTIYNGSTNVTSTTELGGGGVRMTAGTLRNCIVVSNKSQTATTVANYGFGGGICFDGGSTGLVDNCTIQYNSATNRGGGICFLPTGGGKILATNCVIRYNTQTGNTEGGGVYMNGSGAVLANCSVYGNVLYTNAGGGISAGGNCSIMNCVVSNNSAVTGSGGGIEIPGGVIITNCVIISNLCNINGGGIYVVAPLATSTIANCQIIGNRATNTATGNGGGVFITQTGVKANFFNCEIRNNFAGNGTGGVYANDYNSIPIMRNCLIVGNTGVSCGGVRFAYNNNVLENCTIVSNSATAGNAPGGLQFGGVGTNFIANCIIYFNIPGSTGGYSNYWPYGTANIISSFSNCCFAPDVTGTSIGYSTNNIIADPGLIAPASGNYRLARGSRCIDTGANRPWMTGAVDLDGRPRVDKLSGLVDMGSYEYIRRGTMFIIR